MLDASFVTRRKMCDCNARSANGARRRVRLGKIFRDRSAKLGGELIESRNFCNNHSSRMGGHLQRVNSQRCCRAPTAAVPRRKTNCGRD